MSVKKVCETCGNTFSVKKHREATARFCSYTCRGHKVPPGSRGRRPVNAFASGQPAWNRGVRGVHFSPNTEFKPGHRGARTAAVGAVHIRNDHGMPRAFVKVAEPNVWELRSVLEWTKTHGPLPPGHIVHHKNRNTLDDSIDNLEAHTRADHLNEHRGELLAARRKRRAVSGPTQRPLLAMGGV